MKKRFDTFIFVCALCFVLSLIYQLPRPSAAHFKFKQAKVAMISNDKPEFTSDIIPQPQYLLSSHSATFEVLPNGNLIAFWYAGSHEGKSDVKIWCSTYAAKRWSMALIAVSPEMLSTSLHQYIKKVGNPVVYLDSNKILHLFVVSVGAIGGWSVSKLNHLSSIDGGRTWNSIGRLILTPFFNLSTLDRTRAIPLSDGGFYLPVYYEFIETYPLLLRFDIKGKLIQIIRMTTRAHLLQPALVVETEENAKAFFRNNNKKQPVLYMQTTNNGGYTWSNLYATNLTNQDSSIAIAKLSNGSLLMVHNPGDRSKLVLSTSLNGVNWRNMATLEDSINGEFSYPSLQVSGNTIDILYTWQRKKIKHIRFNLAWLEQQGGKKNVQHS